MQINQFLKYRHITKGISLEEHEDFVFLIQNGAVKATFNATKVTEEVLIEEADKLLKDGE